MAAFLCQCPHPVLSPGDVLILAVWRRGPLTRGSAYTPTGLLPGSCWKHVAIQTETGVGDGGLEVTGVFVIASLKMPPLCLLPDIPVYAAAS